MSTNVSEKEGRRIQRISLPLPVRVEVKVDSQVSWNEITRLSDVSAFGCGFVLKRPVKRGRLVVVTIPMPRQLRCFDFSEPQYKIWALVRRCIAVESRSGAKTYSVGVAHIGKTPPPSYFDHPSQLYDISHASSDGMWHINDADLTKDDSDLPADLRRQSRFHIPEGMIIELMDENGEVLGSETTVSENISVGGAAVFTQLDIDTGAFVRVTSQRDGTKIISVVRGKRVGTDGMTRLHLEFIDRHYPLDGIE